MVEIVLKTLLTDERIDRVHGLRRILHQRLVLEQHQLPRRSAAEIGFLQCVEGISDRSVAGRNTFHPGVHRHFRVVAEYLRRSQCVAPAHQLEAIDNPRHVANTGNHFRVREQVSQQRQTRAPGAARIEDEVRRGVCVIALDSSAQNVSAGFIVDEFRELVGAHFCNQRIQHASQRAAHVGMARRVLSQQRSQ